MTFANASDDPVDRRTAAVAEKIGWIRDAAGARFEQIELSLFPDIIITDDRLAAASHVVQSHSWTATNPDDVFDMPAFAIGTVDEIVETLQQRRDQLGVSYLIFGDTEMARLTPVVTRLAAA